MPPRQQGRDQWWDPVTMSMCLGVGIHQWDQGATSRRRDPLVGPWRQVDDMGPTGGTMAPSHADGTMAHLMIVGPTCGTRTPRHLCGTRRWDHSATTKQSGTHRYHRGATPGRWDLLVGPTGTSSALERKNGAMFSIGNVQTINDDSVFLFYDDYFSFIIILCVKDPSHMTNDEPLLFCYGMLSSCDENINVTRES